MAIRKIFCDKTELVLMVVGKKKSQTINVGYDHIKSISFEYCKEFRVFKFVLSERIVITTSKRSEPVVYTKMKNKKYFKQYKQELEEFAKNNRITFHNTLDNEM